MGHAVSGGCTKVTLGKNERMSRGAIKEALSGTRGAAASCVAAAGIFS